MNSFSLEFKYAKKPFKLKGFFAYLLLEFHLNE